MDSPLVIESRRLSEIWFPLVRNDSAVYARFCKATWPAEVAFERARAPALKAYRKNKDREEYAEAVAPAVAALRDAQAAVLIAIARDAG